MVKTALVTGANRGIGFEIARQLAENGFQVIFTSRFTEKGEEALERMKKLGVNVRFEQLDVTDETSIREAFKRITKYTDELNVLVNNAGVLIDGTDNILNIPSSKIYQTMHSNAMSALMVTRAFHSIIPKGGRVIMMSSGGGAITEGISTWAPIYCISKTALNAVTLQLSEVLREKNIAVNAVCPGWVRTDMGGNNATRPVEKGAETPVWLATEAPVEISGKFLRDKNEIPW